MGDPTAAKVQIAEAVPVARIRAVLRLISPDHITPMGKRMIESVLEEYERQVP